MDNFDETKSKTGNSSLTPANTQANATTTPEFTTCDSDIYLAYEQAPTREITNAIELAGLTLDATDLTQLGQAIQAIANAAAIPTPLTVRAQGTITGGSSGTNEARGVVTLVLPAGRKWIDVRVVHSHTITEGSATPQSLKAGGVIQSDVHTLVYGQQYQSAASDGQETVVLDSDYVPTALTSDQVINTFWTWTGQANDTARAAIKAVGRHEAV